LKTTFENIIKIDEHGNAYLQKSTLQLRKKNQLKNIDVYDVWFQPLQNDVSKK